MFFKQAEFLVICLVVFLHLSVNAVEGRSILTREQQQEDMELDKQLEILNKPAIKIFQTKYGDTYGCVDINKQPAFDHPLLKNHTIQLRPSSFPEGMIINEEGSSTQNSSIWHKTETCPHGTVAIKRIQKEDLIRAKSSKKHITSRNNSEEYPGYHVAAVNIHRSGLHGVVTFTNTHQPSVEHGQFSSAGLSISNQKEILAAGWRVDPSIHDDFLARMFIFWTSDDSESTGCYNVFCSGFVQTNTDPIDMVIENISVYGGKQYVFQNSILQDKATGNWWFSYPEVPKQVGYWPKELFKSLSSEGGTLAQWGGQTFSPPGEKSPAMGNGHLPQADLKANVDGYFKNMQFADTDFIVKVPDSSKDFKKVADNKNCYDVGVIIDLDDDEGQAFNYGGPGGDCGN